MINLLIVFFLFISTLHIIYFSRNKAFVKYMSKKQQEQQCFEASQHEQQQKQIKEVLKQLVGQAKPLYSKKLNQQGADYNQTVTLKLVPLRQHSQISSYCPFKIAQSNNQKKLTAGKKYQQIGYQQIDDRVKKGQSGLSIKRSPLNIFYEKSELVYIKFDNSKHNSYKGVNYHTGVFVPASMLMKKLRQAKQISSLQGDKINVNMQSILQPNRVKNQLQNNKNAKRIIDSDRLVFDSNFECGNLFCAYRTDKYAYDLMLSNDTNSRGSTQWFYFCIKNMQPNTDYTFNIVNLTKNDSLFNYGMRPVFYSVIENGGVQPHDIFNQKQSRIGWYRQGKQIKYFKSKIQREGVKKYYYTLSFVISCKNPNDQIYLAHSFPYSYTRVQQTMKFIMQNFTKSSSQFNNKKAIKNSISVEPIKIGKTMASVQLIAYLFTIKKSTKNRPKQAVIIMARQHPGQTQGSYVCEGVISKLINFHSKQATFLLNNYSVYVIPMINPDGVIFGHYRTNLGGKDLNRKWDAEGDIALLVPEVTLIRSFIADLKSKGTSIRFILDLHGHSKKLNSFFYGNPCPESPLDTKLFPYICSRYSQAIQYLDCTFSQQQYKKRAARVYLSSLYRELQIYTFQSSFYGYRTRDNKIVEFTPVQFLKLGQVLLNGLYLLLVKQKIVKNEIPAQINDSTSAESQMSIYKKSAQDCEGFMTQLREDQLLMKVGDECSSGSESHPQQGELNNKDIVFQSEEQAECDSRVVVTSKTVGKAEQSRKQLQISKSKSIRISSRKSIGQNTIEYRDINKGRNKKLITISQVNGVLADKYHISLVPIQRSVYRTGKKVDSETQTEKNDRTIIRSYKIYEIEQRSLTGCLDIRNQQVDSKARVNSTIQTPLKKHSQIVAQIEKNSRHQVFKLNYQQDRNHVSRRKSTVQQILKKQGKSSIYTQTMSSFKNIIAKQKYMSDIIPRKQSYATNQSINRNQNSNSLDNSLTENEVRIAQMEKINREVLRIYSRKSAVVDIGPQIKKDSVLDKRSNIPLKEQKIRFNQK